MKDEAALDDYLEEAGLEGLVLDTSEGQRSGNDLKTQVDHARRMRTLMRYAPRKYDPALIEALAINGALKPNLEKDGKTQAIAKVAAWLAPAISKPNGRGKSRPRAATCSSACGAVSPTPTSSNRAS